ncbi:hypothetical protein LJB42_002112 [Komagataella kurtzmanii]|nr:hypothetical protein LJB42_002112 [Komagataella kurtzmanii]
MSDSREVSPSYDSKSETKHDKPFKSKQSKEQHVLLSTSSPEGIAAAQQVTPARLASLLMENGPLPIRHITAHLSKQISGFQYLSLSKQRRLIISALDSGDVESNCIFEKVGWGQWAAKVVDHQTALEKLRAAQQQQQSSGDHSVSKREQREFKKKSSSPSYLDNPAKGTSSSWNVRRESITNPTNDPHNINLPLSPHFGSLKNSVEARQSSLDQAIESSTSSDDDLYDNENAIDEDDNSDDEAVFSFDDESKFSSRVPIKQMMRRHSSHLTTPRSGIHKPRRSRLNSFNANPIEATLDGNSLEGGLDAAALPDSFGIRRRPRASFSNASSLSRQSFVRTALSPTRNPGAVYSSNSNNSSTARHSTSSVNNIPNAQPNTHHSETDEEDWESMGAASLRRGSVLTPPTPYLIRSPQTNVASTASNSKEEIAVMALMDLQSV